MKTARIGGALITMAALAALSTGSALAQDYPETVLNVQGGWVSAGIYQEIEVPFWTQRLPELTGGAVTANITSLDESGLAGAEVFRLLRLGAIEFGTAALGWAAGDVPQNEGPDLAGVALDLETARDVVDAYSPVLEELYVNSYQTRPLMYYPAEAQVFWCNAPIENLESLRGKKVRTGNRTVADFVDAAGGTTVTMPFGEVVTSLQRGVIDCAVTGTFSGNSAGWHEVTTHLYPLNMGWSIFTYAVNEDVWQGLDPSIRELLTEELGKLEEDIWAAAAVRTEEGLNCATGGECTFGKLGNMTLVPVSEDDAAQLNEMVRDVVIPRFGERCGEQCLDTWRELVGPIVGQAG